MTKSNYRGLRRCHADPRSQHADQCLRGGRQVRQSRHQAPSSLHWHLLRPPKAREAGLAQIDAGADILLAQLIGTADAAKERKIKAVGSLIDYTPRYPDTVFANALWGFRPILNAAIADVAAGGPVGATARAYGLMKEGGERHRLW